MLRSLRWPAIGAVMLLLPVDTACNRFTIAVGVSTPGREGTKTTETYLYPSPEAARHRPVFNCESGRRITVAWKAENTGDAKLQDALIHFFVVKQQRAGQPEVPDLDKNVLHEGALTMDFMPAENSTGKFTMTLDEPGSYLVRVETRGLADSHGHDHFAALDIVVE